MNEDSQAENRRTIALMIAGVKALADKEVTAEEGADLCRLAIDLISRISPMVRSHPKGWLFRMGIHAATCALAEAAEFLDAMEPQQ